MFSAKEICDFATKLENGCYKTLDSFMFANFGLNWWETPSFQEVKNCLDAIMVKVEETHPQGYKVVTWQMK